MPYQKTSQGAYLDGLSVGMNLTETVSGETRYYCLASASIQVAWKGGDSELLTISARVRLKDPDSPENDYKLTQWTAPDIARAISQAVLDADTETKTNYGTGTPGHGIASTTITGS